MELLRDLALLGAIGSLASFAVLFTSRDVFDNVSHELSLNYVARMQGPDSPKSDLRLVSYDDVVIAGSSAKGGFHGAGSVPVTVIAYMPDQPLSTWLSGAVTNGAVCSDGVMLDEATVSFLGAHVGDDLALWWADLPGQGSGAVRLCGVLNPWHPDNSSGNRGYLVASATYLARSEPSFVSLPEGNVENYWLHRVPVGAQTRSAAIRDIIATQLGWTDAVGIIAFVGATLWAFGVNRVWREVLLGVRDPRRVLSRLGALEAASLGFVGSVTLGLALVGSVGSALIARATILGWTHLFVTSRQIVFVSAVLTLIAFAAVVVLCMRAPAEPLNETGAQVTGDLK